MISRRIESTRIVTLLETRRNGVGNDLLGGQVGDGAFKRFCGGNANLAVVFSHHQQQPVADVFAANFPAVADPLGVVGKVFGQRRGHHQDHHLRAARFLKRFQLGVQRLQLRRLQGAGGVDDTRRQRRHGL